MIEYEIVDSMYIIFAVEVIVTDIVFKKVNEDTVNVIDN
jgi:hypothetical protein